MIDFSIQGNGQSVSISVYGYENEHTEDNSDANWLDCKISIKTDPFYGEFRAALTTHDFLYFFKKLSPMLEKLQGEASFQTIEDTIELKLKSSRLGGITVSGTACPFPGQAETKLSFNFEIDQCYLLESERILKSLVEQYPVKNFDCREPACLPRADNGSTLRVSDESSQAVSTKVNEAAVKLDYMIAENRLAADGDILSYLWYNFHYDIFLGDITFIVDGADFSTELGWVPVLDFAVCLSRAVSALTESPHDQFEFTGSSDAIYFLLDNDRVEISSNYVDEIAIVDYSILRERAFLFAVRVVTELGSAYPLLKKNQYFHTLEEEFKSTREC